MLLEIKYVSQYILACWIIQSRVTSADSSVIFGLFGHEQKKMHRDNRANANISNRLRNAINPVSVTWSAGGKTSQCDYGGLLATGCDLT